MIIQLTADASAPHSTEIEEMVIQMGPDAWLDNHVKPSTCFLKYEFWNSAGLSDIGQLKIRFELYNVLRPSVIQLVLRGMNSEEFYTLKLDKWWQSVVLTFTLSLVLSFVWQI